ncbi:MAG: hypothetical protein P5672_26200, partial [Limnospira sp. PMC 1234.20]|uniref:hypothetical protein n=1 Tax=Limnospira sp. PMC 1234.20 TaxID=2981032 RepID=UPI0028E11B7B
MTLRYNSFAIAIEETFTVGGDTVTVSFSETEVIFGGDPFIQLIAENTALDLGGVIAVGAEEMVFTRNQGSFTVTVTDAYAFLGNGPFLTSGGQVNPNAVGVAVSQLQAGIRITTHAAGGAYAVYGTGTA